MRSLGMSLTVGAAALLGACSHPDAQNDALKSDLALAAQAQPYQAQQFVSPGEQNLGGAATRAPAYAAAPRVSAPVARASAPVRRTRSSSRSRGSSSGGNSGTYYPSAPSAPQEPVRHTGRDAAIGAAAGAVIGATTSRDKVRGGIIGAAAGGILGGIIGHTVDVHNP